MKLADRERVDGTCVTIGHRIFHHNGKERTSRRYVAEYRGIDRRQACEKLETTNRAVARRKAIEIQQRLDSGAEPVRESNISMQDVADAYYEAVKAKGIAPKTEWKYRADLAKLKEFCQTADIVLARQFSETDLYCYRQWLSARGHADKTVQCAIVLAKQVFKWAWRQRVLRDYRLAAASFPKAKARPQPCYTSQQVDRLIDTGVGEEKAAFALMGYAGLRIGEVEQLRWEDFRTRESKLSMIHVRRGGSNGTTKDKDERFVPVHPKVAAVLEPMRKDSGQVFHDITERDLLKRLKVLCKSCGFENPEQYKLHSFRHHFASLCANHQVAYRKALAWLGHSSSEILDLYYHLHDEDSRQAMMALAGVSDDGEQDEDDKNGEQGKAPEPDSPSEDRLRAEAESEIETSPQVPEIQALTGTLSELAESEGFEPPDRKTGHRFSRPTHSTALATLRAGWSGRACGPGIIFRGVLRRSF